MDDGKGQESEVFFDPRKISSPVMEAEGKRQSELGPHKKDPLQRAGWVRIIIGPCTLELMVTAIPLWKRTKYPHQLSGYRFTLKLQPRDATAEMTICQLFAS